ncbi:MAG: BPL-N domain-containing protein [Pirellulales bacterium]
MVNGKGTSANDVKAIESLLLEMQLDFDTVRLDELNQTSLEQFKRYKLLVFPGGNYLQMGESLNETTRSHIRAAVGDGLSYLGICAGGLLAGYAEGRGINLADGVQFGFYGVVNQGVHKSAEQILFAGGTSHQHYWEDGPKFTGWGEVVGRYPDQTPAIVQGWYKNGFVLLCGTHPEAPESWRRGMDFSTPAETSRSLAKELIAAAITKNALPSFAGQSE